MFKIRASWGVIGDDNVGGRWLYKDTYAYGGNTTIGSPLSDSPYTIYRQSQLGNSNVRWETVEKRNLGFDFAFLNGLVAGSLRCLRRPTQGYSDQWRLTRHSFLTSVPRRLSANLGKRAQSWLGAVPSEETKQWNPDLRTWANFNMTHAVNKVIFEDDPQLRAAYLKHQGYCHRSGAQLYRQGLHHQLG
jgi:hypothetical protein